MPRPVEGFQAFDGAFFQTEQEAKLYEARLDLDTALRTDIEKYVTDTRVVDFLVRECFSFIYGRQELIRAYLDAKPEKPEEPPEHDIREAVIRSGLERSGDDLDPATEPETGGEIDTPPPEPPEEPF